MPEPIKKPAASDLSAAPCSRRECNCGGIGLIAYNTETRMSDIMCSKCGVKTQAKRGWDASEAAWNELQKENSKT